MPKGMGFQAAAQSVSKKQGIPMRNAAKIIAANARNASPQAKKENPNLKKVKGSPIQNAAKRRLMMQQGKG